MQWKHNPRGVQLDANWELDEGYVMQTRFGAYTAHVFEGEGDDYGSVYLGSFGTLADAKAAVVARLNNYGE